MNYIKIESSSLSNGCGWRVVLWVSGCSHCCKNCHNPETWDVNAGKEYTDKQKQKIMELLSHDYINGLTLSGGDPLHPHNRNEIADLVKTVKNTYLDKDIWLYTGYEYEQIADLDILNYIDYLVDGPYVESLRDVSLPFRGSSNQRIIDIKKTKLNNNITLLDI